MPTPRDSAFQTHSQAGDGPSMPRAKRAARARIARGLDGAAPVWPPHGASHRHQQKHQGFSGFYALGATLPPACHPLKANKIKRLSQREPTMAPSAKPVVPSKTMCRQPLSHIRVAVLLSCPPKVPMPPPPISCDHLPLTAVTGAAARQKTRRRSVDLVPDSRRRTRKIRAPKRRFRHADSHRPTGKIDP